MPVARTNRLVLVEGLDDREVVRHLCNHYGIPRGRCEVTFQEDGSGIDGLLRDLPTILKTEPLYLAIIVDANGSPTTRWQAIRHSLTSAGYHDAPFALPSGGTIAIKGQSRVGVWLMPNNVRPGMLEHFVKDMKQSDDVLWGDAERSVDSIPRPRRLFCPLCPSNSDEECASCSHKMKAYIHTWLAWQKEPGTPLGLAIVRRYADPDAIPGQNLMRWLFRLFEFTSSDVEGNAGSFRYQES